MLRSAWTVLVCLLALVCEPAHAQDYPTKPIVLIVPFAPGGSSEVLARMIGQKLTESWKQQVVVENKPGAAGNIAMEAVQRARPDGYTLILGHVGTLAVNPAMFSKLPYDPVNGFIPVAMIASVPNVVTIHPSVPARTLKEFVDLARAKPGTINYGSAGNGSAGHLAMEYLRQVAGIDLTHVPYKGTGPMTTDLLAGQTQATFTGVLPLMPFIKDGKLRALAVGSARRIPSLPDVPTVAESGYPGFETSQWYGILAPAGTPADIVAKLSNEIRRILGTPEVTGRLGADGSVALAMSPQEFAAFIRKEMERWGAVVKKAGIKVD
jgi:tripartite-type tricarboxylate transporter receptor subunit TctC